MSLFYCALLRKIKVSLSGAQNSDFPQHVSGNLHSTDTEPYYYIQAVLTIRMLGTFNQEMPMILSNKEGCHSKPKSLQSV